MTDIKNKVVDIGVGTLVGIIASIISTTIIVMSFFGGFDKRISIVEERQKHKADIEDVRIINVKLDSMEQILKEIKLEIKKQ